MTSYVFIKNLFTAILLQSTAIQGRFYVGHRYGLQDINYDELGQVVKDTITDPKYPLVMMAPPHGAFKFYGKDNGWEEYRIVLFFCKTSYYGIGANIDAETQTSKHAIYEDWHDMKRCAINFLRQLVNVQRNQFADIRFRIADHQALFVPFGVVAMDRVSGVKVSFDMSLFVGCDLEDYTTLLTTVNVEADGHPQHNL